MKKINKRNKSFNYIIIKINMNSSKYSSIETFEFSLILLLQFYNINNYIKKPTNDYFH